MRSEYLTLLRHYLAWLFKRRHKSGLWMSDIYCDHMVLQRDKLLKIRGHAPAGARVTLSFGEYEKDTFAGIDGCWCIILPPMSKGGPYTMNVRSGWHRLRFKDVVMGEVWLVAGASFMQMHLWGDSNGEQEVKLWEEQQKEGQALFPIRVFAKDMIPNYWKFPLLYGMCRYLDKYELLRRPYWYIINAQTVGGVAAYPYYFAKEISVGLDVPVGLINVSLSGCPIESFVERELLEEQMPDLLKGKPNPYTFNGYAETVRNKNLRFAFNKYQKHLFDPGYAFESQIRSLNAFPVKGALFGALFWHKDLAPRFISLFSMLVGCWRRNWREDIPVYYLQPGRFHDNNLMSAGLPAMRDATRRAEELVPGTYMIIAYDMVDATEKDVIHPRNRMLVGRRFAWSALYHTYGQTEIMPSGPKYLQAQLEDNLIRIRFDWGDNLHTSDGKDPAEFEVASEDFQFVPVNATIEDNQIVIKNILNVPPVYVRYAWKEYPIVNVVNGEGWPISTFCEKIIFKLSK